MPNLNTMRTNLIAAAATLAVAGAAHGQLLVTEFMPNPGGSDADLEWIEIYNSGSLAVDVSNYKVGDEEAEPDGGPGGEGMFQFPAGTTMGAGEVFVIANVGAAFNDKYGFFPDFEFVNSDAPGGVPEMTPYTVWGTADRLAMSNTGDHALIVDDTDTIVDGANHGNVSKFFDAMVTLGTDESLERVPAFVDTDTRDDFVFRGAGEATPGFVTIPEPTSLALLSLGGLAALRHRRA